MLRIAPLIGNFSNLSFGDCSTKVQFNSKVIRLLVIKRVFLVRLNPFVIGNPMFRQLANRTRNYHWQVAHDVCRMTTIQDDFIAESKIGANKRSATSANGSSKAFVMRVTQTNHSADLIGIRTFNAIDLKQCEESLPFASKRVVFLHD